MKPSEAVKDALVAHRRTFNPELGDADAANKTERALEEAISALERRERPARVAHHVRVQQPNVGGKYTLEIDGEEFPWLVTGGVSTFVAPGEMSAIAIRIPVDYLEIESGGAE